MPARRDDELLDLMRELVRTDVARLNGEAQERVISCLRCGEVLATYRVEEDEHVCPRS